MSDSTTKTAGVPLLEQNRSPKFKEILRALERDHPEMPVEMKARIASRKSKKNARSRKSPKHGGPAYKAPITHKRVGEGQEARYVGKTKEQRAKDAEYAEKVAAMDPAQLLQFIVGSSVGAQGPGKGLSGQTAAAIAPTGRKLRSEEVARKGAEIPVLVGSVLGALHGARNPAVRRQALKLLSRARVPVEDTLVQGVTDVALPMAGGLVGGSAAGIGTGAVVGGVARLRGPKKGGVKKEAAVDRGSEWPGPGLMTTESRSEGARRVREGGKSYEEGGRKLRNVGYGSAAAMLAGSFLPGVRGRALARRALRGGSVVAGVGGYAGEGQMRVGRGYQLGADVHEGKKSAPGEADAAWMDPSPSAYKAAREALKIHSSVTHPELTEKDEKALIEKKGAGVIAAKHLTNFAKRELQASGVDPNRADDLDLAELQARLDPRSKYEDRHWEDKFLNKVAICKAEWVRRLRKAVGTKKNPAPVIEKQALSARYVGEGVHRTSRRARLGEGLGSRHLMAKTGNVLVDSLKGVFGVGRKAAQKAAKKPAPRKVTYPKSMTSGPRTASGTNADDMRQQAVLRAQARVMGTGSMA